MSHYMPPIGGEKHDYLPADTDCVDADGDVWPEHDFPPGAHECRRCGAETDDDGPDGIYDGEIR